MAEKTSVWKKALLKTGFFEVEDNGSSNQEPNTSEQSVEKQEEAQAVEAPSPLNDTGEIKGVIDSEIKKTLEEELNELNGSNSELQGVDFFEFKRGFKGTSGSSKEERAKNAFRQASAFSPNPLTKEFLLKTAGIYKNALLEEKRGFEEHVGQIKSSEIGPKQEELTSLKSLNEAIDKKIEELNIQKSENIARINEIEGDVYTAQRNINQKVANFKATLDEVIKEHDEVVEAVNTLPDDSTAKV